MSLRITPPLLASRGSGYNNRVMVYAHRRQKAFYQGPKKAHRQDPTMNKPVEEYGNTWDPRTGIDWYYRMRNRNHYRHWPWARWTDDPIRHHEDTTHRRTFSALQAAANEAVPEWNYYAEVGQDYATPSHFPVTYVAPFIHQYTGKVWSRDQITTYLERVAEGTGLRTIAEVAQNPDAVLHWGHYQSRQREQPSSGAAASTLAPAVPLGLLLHLRFVAEDLVSQNARKGHRQEQHEQGVLRTREMERYYALPYMREGPAMPEKLAQASGDYPWGKYTYIKEPIRFHPLQLPDGRYKHGMYPI